MNQTKALCHLVSQKKARIGLTFAGQANDYIRELRDLWQRYSIVKTLVKKVNNSLAEEIETPQAILSGYFSQGLFIEKWLQNEKSVPQDEYLFSSPISQPLVILTQIANYLSLCIDGYSNEEIENWAIGATGHSQGVVPALIVSMGLSFDDIMEQTCFAAKYLLWQGIRMEQAHDFIPSSNKEAIKELGTKPKFMAAVGGFTSKELQQILDSYNENQTENRYIYLSLDNETMKKVVSGPPESLEELRLYLKNDYVKRYPFPLRDMRFTYLNTSAPFHSPYMESCIEPTLKDVERIGWKIDVSKCKIPVYDFVTGDDLRDSDNIMRQIIFLQGPAQLVWKNALNPLVKNKATHLIDFGPGDGITKLSRSFVTGFGIKALCVSNTEDRSVINTTEEQDVPFEKPWVEFLPTISEQGGKKIFHNAFTKFCGRSPVILPGMTPTTATAEIIWATANAGYLAELAGGGQVTEKMFRERMKEISEKLDPHQGVVLNTLYLDPYLWNLQIKNDGLLFKLKEEGYPFIGITISAGLPPVEEAVTLLDNLHNSGMFLNAFKAGTDEQIKHILEIAAQRPQYTICMQVEGGLAGGHHGWYDVRHVLLKNYHRIRQHKNVLLLAGGGIREEQDAVDFVMGTWNKEFEVPIMPIDGVFLGTLAMACRESEASEDCKKALAATEGTSDWITSMATGEIKGGMTSGKSSLDADIYYIENKAAEVGRFLDSVAGNKEEVAKNKARIVEMLNETSRPYLGNLETMTYFELLEKMIQFMAVGKSGRYDDGCWLDITYRSRFDKMLKRSLQRFRMQDKIDINEENLQSPKNLLQDVALGCPEIKSVVLAPEDKIFFIHKVCQVPGKPVNFVPIIDENIRKWYKGDSLHNCNSSLFPADEVFQTPGPRAISGIREINEPVATLFHRFHQALVAQASPEKSKQNGDNTLTFTCEDRLTPIYWQRFDGKVATLLQSYSIIRNSEICENYISKLLQLVTDDRIIIEVVSNTINKLELQRENKGKWSTLLEIRECDKGIELKIYHSLMSLEGKKSSSYSTYFTYKPEHMQPYNIEEIEDGRVDRIAQFYSELLLEKAQKSPARHQNSTFELSQQDVRNYIASLGGKENDYTVAPLSMAFVIAWQPVFGILLHKDCVGDFFTLVHLANKIAKIDIDGLVAARSYQVEAALESVSYGKEGKKVVVIAQIKHEEKVIVVLESQFLLREKVSPTLLGQKSIFENSFAYPTAKEKSLSRPYYAYEENVIAPKSGDTYAMVSKDFNPLHRDDLIAKLAGFDNPILHGMWSKGIALQILRQEEGILHQNVTRIETQFSSPAIHGDSLWTYARHIAMSAGEKVYEINCAVENKGSRIPTVTGKVYTQNPQVAMIFPGQGIQAKGMGMDGYARSAAVRNVWDRADIFTRSHLGFSILQIVQENPTELIVSGEIVRHEKGVLFLTQFTQVALVTHALASIEELKEADLYVPNHYFCGHSIGEYSAISACGILPLEKVVAVVYQRGLTMQNFVPRNEQGQSPYRMGVVCPHRAKMSEEQAIELVDSIRQNTNQTLEIVNYNVLGRQYAVAGHVIAISALNSALSKLSKPTKPAYMNIPGLDVPFHSSVLQNGVDHFRQVLVETFAKGADLTLLNQRYIPNLVARPFELSKSFFGDIYQLTKSPIMSEILNDIDTWLAKPQECSRKVLIELLAYQFAFPVRWIETQKLLLENQEIEQIWEVGVGYQPTLTNMFGQTLATKKYPIKLVYNIERDRSILYFLDGEAELPSRNMIEEVINEESQVESSVKEAPIVKLPMAKTSSSEGAKPPTTSLVKHSLRTILALQTKIWPSEMKDDESIDQLLGGNSSRRNQAVVDIWTEFNIAPIDGGHELPLVQLEEAIQGATGGRYTSPGSYLKIAHTEAIKRIFAKVGNVTLRDIVKFVQENWIIDDITIFQVLSSIAFTAGIDSSSRSNAPSSIDKDIKNSKEAHTFIENVLSHYQGNYGWSFSRISAESSGAQVDSAAVDKILERYFGVHGVFAELARCTQQFLGHDPYAAMISREKEYLEEEKLELYKSEHGAKYISSIKPHFYPRKARSFTSVWNWTRAQIISFYWDVINGRSSDEKYRHISDVVCSNPITEVILLIQGLKEKSKDNTEVRDILENLYEKAVHAEKNAARQITLKPTAPNVVIDQHGIHFSEISRDKQQNANDFVACTKIKVSPKDTNVIAEKEAGKVYHDSLEQQANKGISFVGKVALVTGAGERAIATSVVKNLLRGGANVIITTTRPTPKRIQYYKELYRQNAGYGAQLHIVPFNQGCGSDIRDLSEWIYKAKGDHPAWQLDYFMPFGAIPEESNLLTLDDGSVATMRVMLFGVEYLLGKIAEQAIKSADNRKKIQVILPLSPNHGQFGNDGMYAETKAGLEVLLNKWKSEYDLWGKACSIVGAQIGWVRGTSLMSANDIVAAGLESKRQVRTYSCDEMAFLLTGLLHKDMCQAAQKTPLKVNLMGKMEEVPDLGQALREIRLDLQKQVEEKKSKTSPTKEETVLPLNLSQFPKVPTSERLAKLPSPSISLEETIVIVGYGEVGTFGNAQIRWDLENLGKLSETRALELARIIGLVEFTISRQHVGWIDVETGNKVDEKNIAAKYHDQLISAIGIRDIDPKLAHFDPHKMDVYSEVSLESEVKFRVDDRESAASYKKANPEKVDFFYDDDLGCYWVLLHKATKIRVPKHASFDRNVAGQIPSGWSANRFGLPNDMCQHLDYNTQYSLIGTADAFVSAGIEPEELYKYAHPSKVGNTLGSGLGGGQSLSHLSRDLILDDARQGDRIQETLVNVMGAYNVQSFVGSYGTVASPANACATAAISVEIGMEKILSNKADFIVAGSYDDLTDTGVLGFKDMNATANTDDMKERGFAPHEMSRPNDSMRSGFVEAQGGGTILMCRASLAVEVGLPVYGIVAMSYSATDGINQSIPAPGLGLLSVGGENEKSPSMLRQSLSNYGLTADDLTFISKHDTSTLANDKNESQLYHSLMKKLGRTEGLPLMVISQKSITGHSKGGAAAWQMNGILQAMQTGVIPGNKNLLDIDIKMKEHTFLSYNDQSVDVGSENITAGLLTSLGFGHVGAMLCFIHPDFFFKMLSQQQRESYVALRQKRWEHRYKRERNFLIGNESLLQIRDKKPYSDSAEQKMLLSPDYRQGK